MKYYQCKSDVDNYERGDISMSSMPCRILLMTGNRWIFVYSRGISFSGDSYQYPPVVRNNETFRKAER